MSAAVDQVSSFETHKIKMSGTSTSSSGTSATGPKTSIFAAKSGFVIPKNKLLSSLVPKSKGGKRLEDIDAANEENANQSAKKTKWGPDPSRDADVRKGKALAYQTRVDQITQQLKSGFLKSGNTQDSDDADQHADPMLSSSQNDTKEFELLKLEWREIIGEILKLNPSYKAPPDYEPVLKEATVPIPLKDYPRCNFVGLIFGPGGETQKRLEKDTGAKIQLCGTKADTGERVDISPNSENDLQVVYEELNIHVSADTFEKVDGAIALIEQLVTSVLGKLMNAINQSQFTPTLSVLTTGDQRVGRLVDGPAQMARQGQFQFNGIGFSSVLSQAPGPPPDFISIQNSSAPISNGLQLLHSSPLNPMTAPSAVGSQAFGFSENLQNTFLSLSRPQVPSHPYTPRNLPIPTPHPSFAQASILPPRPLIGNQPPQTQLATNAGPLASSLPQPVSILSHGQQFDRPLAPVGSWSAAPTVAPVSSGNTGWMVPSAVSLQNPQPFIRPPGFLSAAPPSIMHGSIPISSSVEPTLQKASQAGIAGLFPGHGVNSTVTRPQIGIPNNHIPNPANQLVPGPNNQGANQSSLLNRSPMLPSSAQGPSFRSTVQDSPPFGVQLFSSPRVHNHTGQTQFHLPPNQFSGNSTGNFIPTRALSFSNASALARIRNFGSTPRLPNLEDPFPPRPVNHQQNYPALNPRGNFVVHHQHSSKSPSLPPSLGGQQIYDPFSPS